MKIDFGWGFTPNPTKKTQRSPWTFSRIWRVLLLREKAERKERERERKNVGTEGRKSIFRNLAEA